MGSRLGQLTAEQQAEIDAMNASAPAPAAPSALNPQQQAEIDAMNGLPAGAGALAAGADQPQPTKTESFLRGAGQGASFNFSDELAGAASALFGGEGHAATRYRTARDESRAKNKAASEANPLTYTAGEVGGSVATSFVPGVGVARGAGALKAGLQAAKVGAISGLGASEAQDLTGQLADAGRSAALSGLTGAAVNRVLAGAPTRAVQRRLGDVTGGATATMRDKVVGKAGEKVDDTLTVLGEKPFRKAGADSGKLFTATEDAIADTGARLDAAYAKAGAGAPSIPVVRIQKTLDKFAAQLDKDPGKAALGRQVRGLMNDVWQSWGDRKVVTAQDVRTLAGDVADAAFRGSPAVSPKAGQAVSREVWKDLKGLIDESLEAGAAGSSKEVRALNSRLNTLMNMREAVRYKATREATESTRLKDVMGKSADIALLAYDPVTFAGKKGLEYLGKPIARAADDRLADIVNRAAAGEPIAKLKERAIMMGLGPVAGEALASWAYRTYNQVHGGYQANDQGAAASP